MMTLTLLLIVAASFVSGVVSLLTYMVLRAKGSPNWDDSNIVNAIRLLFHTISQTEDFGKMYYLTQDQLNLLQDNGHGMWNAKPFWYVSKDELSEVVQSRPKN